jgi:hypothetical protein
MVLHAARAAGVAVEEDRVAVRRAEVAGQALERRVVRIVERPQPRLQRGAAERPREDRRLAHRVRAHHAARRAHHAVMIVEIVAPPVDVHEHARERRRQHGAAVLVQVAVEIGRERVGEAVRERGERRIVVVGERGPRKRLRAVVRDADQHGRPRARPRVSDDQERSVHRQRFYCDIPVALVPTLY